MSDGSDVMCQCWAWPGLGLPEAIGGNCPRCGKPRQAAGSDVTSDCAACGEPVSYTDEGGCVGTLPNAYHFRASCLLEALRRESVEVERLREALDKPLRETILAVLRTMPTEAAPEHLAAQIESQVRAWQAIPSDITALSVDDGREPAA